MHGVRIIGRQALYTAYGLDIHERGDDTTKTAEHALEVMDTALTPGQFLVDVIPIRTPYTVSDLHGNLTCVAVVRYLPEWLPGVHFKRQARLWKISTKKLLHSPFELARELLVCKFTDHGIPVP